MPLDFRFYYSFCQKNFINFADNKLVSKPLRALTKSYSSLLSIFKAFSHIFISRTTSTPTTSLILVSYS